MQNHKKQFEFLNNYLINEIKTAKEIVERSETDSSRLYALGQKDLGERMLVIISEAEAIEVCAETLHEAVNDFNSPEGKAQTNDIEQRAKEKKPNLEGEINHIQNQAVAGKV
jgi:hypothetical protein